MPRHRQPANIRADALSMAVKKLGSGCEGCAQSYVKLAREHGATEEDIEQAIAGAADGAGNAISRADALKLAAVGATRIAALAVAGTALPQLALQAAARTTATNGAQVLWVIALTPQGTVQLTHILRSQDGASLYVLSAPMGGMGGSSATPTPTPATMTSTTRVDTYDAATGALRTTITGQAISLGLGPDGYEVLTPALSPDGRYLAVLRQIYFIVTPNIGTVLKALPDGTTRTITLNQTTVIDGLEMFDLSAGRSLGYIQLDVSPNNQLSGQILFAPDGHSLYVFTSDRDSNASAARIAFDGATLRAMAQAKNGKDGHAITSLGPSISPSNRIQADGRTLFRFGVSSVEMFDLTNLTRVQQVDITPLNMTARPVPSVALFSSDGTMLYVANVGNATVQAVDLAAKTLGGRLTLPVITPSPTAPDMRFAAGLQGASLSADGSRLYLIDGRGGDGIAVLSLPNLQVVDHWLAGQYLRAVQPSLDGQTVFAVGFDDGLVHALDSGGHVLSTTPTGTPVYGVIGSQTAQFA